MNTPEFRAQSPNPPHGVMPTLPISDPAERQEMTITERMVLLPQIATMLTASEKLHSWLFILEAKAIHQAEDTVVRPDFSFWNIANLRKHRLLVRSLDGGEQIDLFWYSVTKKATHQAGIECILTGWVRAIKHRDGYRHRFVHDPIDYDEYLKIDYCAKVDGMDISKLKSSPDLQQIDETIDALEWFGRKLSDPSIYDDIDINDVLEIMSM